jgi:hypothetical protein
VAPCEAQQVDLQVGKAGFQIFKAALGVTCFQEQQAEQAEQNENQERCHRLPPLFVVSFRDGMRSAAKEARAHS